MFYKDINLYQLAQQYGTPLEVAYTDMINERVDQLKSLFKQAITASSYPGKFIYAYATKANYYSEVIATALNNCDAIETSSPYDLYIIEKLVKENMLGSKKLVICNGFKTDKYFNKILDLKKLGVNIIPVLENKKEVDLFINKTKLQFEVGLRVNIEKKAIKLFNANDRLSSNVESRFGLYADDLEPAAEQLVRSGHLKLKLFHFHIGGMIENISRYLEFIDDIFEHEYCPLAKKFDIKYFDIGGGLPVQYDLKFNFDYKKLVYGLVETIARQAGRQNITPPSIIGEFGRYTVNDHGFSIFRINFVKPTQTEDTYWYIINSSLMNFLPDSWALGQDFVILPLNRWHQDYCRVRLGGMTCDPDDTYYKNEKENILYLPKIGDAGREELLVGVFGVGAYQEMISGVGGVHHCLLPEGTELIVYKKSGKLHFDRITPLQTPRKVMRILDYHGHHDLSRYFNTK